MAMEGNLLQNLMKKPITRRFPYDRAQPVKGMRGKVTVEIEKCIGCTLCERICPSRAIEVIGKGRSAEITYHVGRCLFCGECVDVCPTEAIKTTKEFELAFTRPSSMIIEFRRTKSIKSKPEDSRR
ncbi:MAG: 4Fe-4S binding protein [Candidatus Bathyarchaeia archaeon]